MFSLGKDFDKTDLEGAYRLQRSEIFVFLNNDLLLKNRRRTRVWPIGLIMFGENGIGMG